MVPKSGGGAPGQDDLWDYSITFASTHPQILEPTFRVHDFGDHFYSESNLPKLQARHGLRRDRNGEVELLRRFWKFDQWEKKDLQTAPPLLVYADLISTADDRNLETAEIIYEQYIARLVE